MIRRGQIRVHTDYKPNWTVDQQQASEFLRYLSEHALLHGVARDQPDGFYGKSIVELCRDQPDGFATEEPS